MLLVERFDQPTTGGPGCSRLLGPHGHTAVARAAAEGVAAVAGPLEGGGRIEGAAGAAG